LLVDIRQRFSDRFVILDSPSMTDSADARILLELCDYVLLVVPYGRATSAEVEESIKAVDGEKFLGVVFNDEPRLPAIDWGDVPRASLRLARRLLGDFRRNLTSRGMGLFKRTRSAK
jgi:Mrp family chromosome partitioning ATPase